MTKQLTIISGKGGTGKTSIAGAFAALAKDKVLADCDVDAANLHLLLHPRIQEEQEFKGLDTANINETKCIKCKKCVEHCRFNAIEYFQVNPLLCEGCAVCTLVCPVNAVTMKKSSSGKAFVSKTKYGTLCHARLYPGEEASGKLVSLVRNKAIEIAEKNKNELVIVDGSPGIGCPVIASLTGSDLALIVTEPTLSGIHDLERILDVTKHFKVKATACINKFDMNPENTKRIQDYCKKHGIEISGKIPYDPIFSKSQIEGKPVTAYDPQSRISTELKHLWEKTKALIYTPL